VETREQHHILINWAGAHCRTPGRVRLTDAYRALERAGKVVFTLALIGRLAGRMAARAAVGREVAGRGRAGLVDGLAPASFSESASNCRMISAFSHFSARLRLRLPSGVSRNRAAVANTARAIMTVGDMPNMFWLPWTSGGVRRFWEAIFQCGTACATGYQGR